MRLKILTWNISFAYGPGSDGLEGVYRPKPKSHFIQALTAISDVMIDEKIDIALLQEVDFDSKRSHHLNQLDWIAQKSNLAFQAPLLSWNCPYVPYPGLNPKNHFGLTRSGGGVLSRFPIRQIRSELLPKPIENGLIYNFFYLHRFLHLVEIEGLRICNLHLEAFSKENRDLHLNHLATLLEDQKADLAGGDFNGESRIPVELEASWTRIAPPHPTFPSPRPTEVLDQFLIRKNRLKLASVKVLGTGTVSDHLPVLIEVEFEKA